MKNLFKVTTKVGSKHSIELFFDDQNRAERFIHATKQILNSDGRKSVEFEGEIIEVIDSDNDILNAYKILIGS